MINKNTHAVLDSFRLRTEIQSDFPIDVHEENLHEHGSSLILENSIVLINISTPNASDKMNKHSYQWKK